MDANTGLLQQVVDLLTLIAEPQIAKRDEKLRESLTAIVGKSSQRTNAVLLMDGKRGQAVISKEAGIDAGALSRLTKALREAKLLESDNKALKLAIPLPHGFGKEMEN